MGIISDGEEAEYSNNHLILNTSETKQIFVEVNNLLIVNKALFTILGEVGEVVGENVPWSSASLEM